MLYGSIVFARDLLPLEASLPPESAQPPKPHGRKTNQPPERMKWQQ